MNLDQQLTATREAREHWQRMAKYVRENLEMFWRESVVFNFYTLNEYLGESCGPEDCALCKLAGCISAKPSTCADCILHIMGDGCYENDSSYSQIFWYSLAWQDFATNAETIMIPTLDKAEAKLIEMKKGVV